MIGIANQLLKLIPTYGIVDAWQDLDFIKGWIRVQGHQWTGNRATEIYKLIAFAPALMVPCLADRRSGWPIQYHPKCLFLRLLDQQDNGPDKIQITFVLRCNQQMSCQ